MNKSESIVLETIAKKIWDNLNITDIHINHNHWHLNINSLIHNKDVDVRVFIYDNLEFNKNGYINIKVKNSCLIKSLDSNKPIFIFALDRSKRKIYYSDLQYLARVNFPTHSEGKCFIKIYEVFDLDKRATRMLADHLLEYNYDWKSLYVSYKKYLSDLEVYKHYINNHFNVDCDEFKEYYRQTIHIFRTLNVVNSKLDIDSRLLKNKESKLNFIKLINANIDWIKWLIKDEKKYWLNNDVDFFLSLRRVRKISL